MLKLSEPPGSPGHAERTEALESSADQVDRLLRPVKVRELYGVSPTTLRSWAVAGKIRPAQRTAGGHRRYRESDVRTLLAELEAVA